MALVTAPVQIFGTGLMVLAHVTDFLMLLHTPPCVYFLPLTIPHFVSHLYRLTCTADCVQAL